MPILMFLSMKGGVGKTASAVATAECLAEAGNRVLVIDTDHQCGASSLLLGDDAIEKLEESRKTLADMFLSMLTTEFPESTEKSLERFIVGRASNITEVAPYLHIIPGSLRLEDFWTRLSPKNRATHSPDEWAKIFYNQHAPKFRKWLLRNFDVVIIDCPPTIAWQVRFFLRVADGFIIPSIPDRLSVRGVLYLQQRLHNLHMTRIQPLGTLWTMVRGNVVSHQNMMQGHATLFPGARPLPQPFTTSIPNTASFITVTTPDLTFTTYAQKYGTELAPRYRTFCKDLLERTRHLRNQPASLVAQTETAP